MPRTRPVNLTAAAKPSAGPASQNQRDRSPRPTAAVSRSRAAARGRSVAAKCRWANTRGRVSSARVAATGTSGRSGASQSRNSAQAVTKNSPVKARTRANGSAEKGSARNPAT